MSQNEERRPRARGGAQNDQHGRQVGTDDSPHRPERCATCSGTAWLPLTTGDLWRRWAADHGLTLAGRGRNVPDNEVTPAALTTPGGLADTLWEVPT